MTVAFLFLQKLRCPRNAALTVYAQIFGAHPSPAHQGLCDGPTVTTGEFSASLGLCFVQVQGSLRRCFFKFLTTAHRREPFCFAVHHIYTLLEKTSKTMLRHTKYCDLFDIFYSVLFCFILLKNIRYNPLN